MFTSEYSSSLACSLPFSNLVNMVRSEAISSALAFSVIKRQSPLVEADVVAAAIDVHRDDGVPERGIGPALEAFRAADGLDGNARRRFRLGGRGPGLNPDVGRT